MPVTARIEALLIAVLLAVIGLRFAEPLQDGDLFFHMAYARQMLERGTLLLDHAAFSWTPAVTDMIYCAWASELFFYALWERLGITALFVLRYVVVLLVAGLVYLHARRLGLWRSLPTHLIVLLLVLASYTGTLVKPEIFSLLGINVLVHVVFWAKQRRDQAAEAARLLYLIPLLLLVWVNSHGGFILAAPFLLTAAVGEGLNRRWSPGLAFNRRTYVHLLASWALTAAAVTVTPYGMAYPLQLFGDYVLGQRPRPDVGWNTAHRSIIQSIGGGFFFEELFVLMAGVLVVLGILRYRHAARGARVDWTIVLANLVYVPLSVVYLRTTFYWPAIFAYSALYQLYLLGGERNEGLLLTDSGRSNVGAVREPPEQARRRGTGAWGASRSAPTSGSGEILRECAVALFLFLAVRAGFTAWYYPLYQSWLGFGISYINPVPEAEFLAQHRLGPRLYNIFDSGSYLLWRLGPAYKVMTDARSFPYLSWFDAQYHFTNGENVETFMQQYVADVAVIDLMKVDLARWFARAPDWQLTFYGPTAAVFVRRGAAVTQDGHRVPSDELLRLRNARTALTVFDFAVSVDDFATAWAVLDDVQRRLAYQADAPALRQAVEYREAHRALRAGDLQRAGGLFNRALHGKALSARDEEIARLYQQLAKPGADAGAINAALQQLAAPM